MIKGVFSKSYTRDFSIIMEEAWYHALSKGLWDILELPAPDYWPNIYYFNKGIIEVWDNNNFIQEIFVALRTKKNNQNYFNKLIQKYKIIVKSLSKTNLSDIDYIENLFEAISIFSIIWYGHLDEETSEELRQKFINVRDEDTIFDSNDKRIRGKILKKYPSCKGFETTILKDEFLGNLPSFETLKKRLENFVLVPGVFSGIISFNEFVKIHDIKIKQFKVRDKEILKGVVATPGIVKGRVRIIRMKTDIQKMQNGEIIVSPMTTPDVLPAVNKAVAIVTDEGSITCHAAIVSRELKIPCIIGTKVASEIFKDGDIIEVDAEKGVVRRIE